MLFQYEVQHEASNHDAVRSDNVFGVPSPNQSRGFDSGSDDRFDQGFK